jgi:hypothetical protein
VLLAVDQDGLLSVLRGSIFCWMVHYRPPS